MLPLLLRPSLGEGDELLPKSMSSSSSRSAKSAYGEEEEGEDDFLPAGELDREDD
jgi:hypothetical protein